MTTTGGCPIVSDRPDLPPLQDADAERLEVSVADAPPLRAYLVLGRRRRAIARKDLVPRAACQEGQLLGERDIPDAGRAPQAIGQVAVEARALVAVLQDRRGRPDVGDQQVGCGEADLGALEGQEALHKQAGANQQDE